MTVFLTEQKRTLTFLTETEDDIHAVSTGRIYARQSTKEKVIVRAKLATPENCHGEIPKFNAPKPIKKAKGSRKYIKIKDR